MTKTTLYISIGILALSCSLVHAAKPFDPAAQAKMIAPFIEEETVGLVHVDLTKIDVDALEKQIIRYIPDITYRDKTKQHAKDILRAIEKAGAKDFFGVLSLGGNLRNDLTFAVVPLRPGIDKARLLNSLSPMFGNCATIMTTNDSDYLVVAIHKTLERLKQNKPEARPELEKALEATGDTAFQVIFLPPKHTARTIAEVMPKLPEPLGGGPSSVLTRGCLWAAVGVDLAPKFTIRAVIQSADAEASKALAEKWPRFANSIVNELPLAYTPVNAEQLIEALAPRVKDDRLVWAFDEANQDMPKFIALITPSIEIANESAQRAQSLNNLKQIAIAMLNYESLHKVFPPAASRDKDGRPLLSWRVHILPYLDELKLYKQFHLDEPWDSAHNKKLIAKMPKVYRSPGSEPVDLRHTNYVVPIGKGTVFEGETGKKISEITDGTSMTIMVVEANDEHASIWTKPDDLPFDPKNPKKGLGGLWRDNAFLCVLCDGSAYVLSEEIKPKILRRLFLKNDGSVIDWEDVKNPGKK